MRSERFFIVGGAGFIGSHFSDRLMDDPKVQKVTVYDNFSSGREWHIEGHLKNPKFKVIRADVKEIDKLTDAMRGHDTVIHLASNPDIAKAATHPDVDFWEGTYLTQNVVESMRRAGVTKILYASGSGVYGDIGNIEAHEDRGPNLPVSTYGASKLAGENLICSYSFMFGIKGLAFRFGNVVGPRQTHGVGFDFVRSLRQDSSKLKILGDGQQSKSYILVTDVVSAVLLANDRCTRDFECFNVATGDYITVKEIADLAVECVGLSPSSVRYEFTGGNKGWKGDVPVIRLNTDRIRALGWSNSKTCHEAMKESMTSLLSQAKSGLI